MSVLPVEQALEASEQFLRQVHDYIRDQIQNTFLDKIPGVDVIVQSVEHLLDVSINTIAGADATIKQQIAPLIENGLPSAIGSLVGIAEAIEKDVGTLLGEIATGEDVTNTAINEIRKWSPHLATWLYHNVIGQLGNVALSTLKTMEGQEPAGINALLDELLKLPNQPKWFAELLHGFRHRGAEWQALALPAVLVSTILAGISAVEEPLRTGWTQEAFQQFPSRQLPIPDLITSALRGHMKHDAFDSAMRDHGFLEAKSLTMLRNAQPLVDPATITRAYLRGFVPHSQWEAELVSLGYDTERARVHWLAEQQVLSEEGIRNSFLRNIINAEQHDAALALHGYSSEVAHRMRQLYFYVPPVADLIHMGIRNVFVPEIVERFSLDHDKPQAFVDAARQQGVSADWAAKYWQAHWIMPGREAFFGMFQRTVDEPLDTHADKITLSDGTEVYNIIGRDTLNLALRDIDTPPFYRDKLTQLAYRPLTRIDIRRLAALGLLNHAGVERAYLDNGYSQKNARRLADFVDSLNHKAKKDEAAQLVDNLRREVVRLYVSGKLSEDAIKDTLKDLLFTDAEIEVFVREAELVRESQFATALESGIGKLYMNGIITDKEAIKRMEAAHVPRDAQSLLFQKWDLEIEFRGGTEHLHKHRELTASEVEQALADGLISADDAKQHFLDMGFDDDSATGKVSLTLFKASRATKNAQVAAIRASYVNGTIEALEASNRLDALLVPSQQRDAYLNTWTLERETRTERIPLATLRDMAQGDWITQEELIMHLKRHRFTDDDASLIARYWMAQKPPKSLVPAQ